MANTGVQTVLVVEDEASYVEALIIGLTREGFRVEVAVDAASEGRRRHLGLASSVFQGRGVLRWA